MYIILLCLTLSLVSPIHISPSQHLNHDLTTPKHYANWGHFNNEGSPPQNQLKQNWMSTLRDSRIVSHLSIPGTHDTGTYLCRGIACPWAKCQSWSIYDQLIAGIRYLDLRIDVYDDHLGIGHGSVKDIMSLDHALNDVYGFLDNFPTEFVILAFQQNSGNGDPSNRIVQMMNNRGIKAVFKNNRPTLPTVGQLRGKVWIFAGLGVYFSGYDTYLMRGDFGDRGISDGPNIYLQNLYSVGPNFEEKDKKVYNTAFEIACSDTRMKVNFLSTSSPPLTPQKVAKTDGCPNQLMNVWLNEKRWPLCLGITIMDFPGGQLIGSIIYFN